MSVTTASWFVGRKPGLFERRAEVSGSWGYVAVASPFYELRAVWRATIGRAMRTFRPPFQAPHFRPPHFAPPPPPLVQYHTGPSLLTISFPPCIQPHLYIFEIFRNYNSSKIRLKCPPVLESQKAKKGGPEIGGPEILRNYKPISGPPKSGK